MGLGRISDSDDAVVSKHLQLQSVAGVTYVAAKPLRSLDRYAVSAT